MSDAGEVGAVPPSESGAVKAARPTKAEEAAAVAEFKLFLREITPRSWVVPTIIAANLIVFVAMVATGISAFTPTTANVMAWGANYGPRTFAGQPWRLLTNVFLHFGAVHLLLNMAALWDAGGMVERIFGPLRFAAIYLAAGLCGSAVSLAVHPNVTSAGASGAVFGVYGALAAFLFRHRGSIPPAALSKLGRVAMAFIGYNVIYGFTNPSIDAAAHAGGLLAGAAAGAWLALPLQPGRPTEPRGPALVVATACLLAVVMLVAMPRPADLDAVVDGFEASESQIIDEYNALIEQGRKNDLQPAAVAKRIEGDILPRWRAASARLRITGRWNRKQQALLELLQRWADAREESWALFATALRTDDRDTLEAYKARQAESDRLVQEIKDWKP